MQPFLRRRRSRRCRRRTSYAEERAASYVERSQISVAVAEKREGIRWLVVLHEKVLRAGNAEARENCSPRDRALADVNHLSGGVPVLDVKQREAARIPPEVG